ncbi:MAG TPA: preprotein translocase subunit YajC [Candidatus Omnitrophota bacterium]|jgi:preprotein translocase subunit YajC|nr:preprotein translocase subunit YajC [Candidatus Omnitrophota bacterium]HSA31053.1 preprotein translocase subunit YajC [Candidatus Omnitrophota bacterium]
MPAGQNAFFQLAVPLLFMFLMFQILVIRPEKKKQQEHKKRIDALQKNDRVVTAGGIYGTVVQIKEKTIVLRVDDNVRIEFDKESISTIKDPQN